MIETILIGILQVVFFVLLILVGLGFLVVIIYAPKGPWEGE